MTEAQLLGDSSSSADDTNKVEIRAVRVGLTQTSWAQSIERTGVELGSLKEESADDGFFWCTNFAGKEPPPLERRCEVGAHFDVRDVE